jgi:glutaredoxin
MIKVEVFSSPGCAKCGQARTVLKAVAEELGADRVQWRDVDILEEMDYAVALGVMVSPSIAIDGELVFASLPSVRTLRAELEKRLQPGPAT